MRTELFSVRQSDEESLLFNKKIKKLISKLEKECSLRILFKTEIDCNPKKLKKDMLDCLAADNPPELFVYINALDTTDSSSFRRLFAPALETLEKSLDSPTESDDGEILYPNIKVYPIKGLKGDYPGYCFTIRNRKFIVLPRISLIGGSLSEYLCEAVNLSKEIFNTAYTECPDGYVFLPREKKEKFSLSSFFAGRKKKSAPVEETKEVSAPSKEMKVTKEEKKSILSAKSNSVAGSAILEDFIEEEEAMKILDPKDTSEIDSFCIPAIEKNRESDTSSHNDNKLQDEASAIFPDDIANLNPSLEIDLSEIQGVEAKFATANETAETSEKAEEDTKETPKQNKQKKKKNKNNEVKPQTDTKASDTPSETKEDKKEDKADTTAKEESSANTDEEAKDNEATKDKSIKEKFIDFIKSFIPSKHDDKKTIISKSVVLAAIAAFLVGGGMLLNFYVIQPYINSRNMNDIQDVFYSNVITDENGNVIVDSTTKNWKGLKKINKEIVAWLKIENSEIDYPVLYHKGDNQDSQYYLDRNYKKQKSAYGSIFIDYRCKKGVGSKNLILHGHNMEDGSMFASLIKYGKGDVKYYKTAPTVSFATPNRDEEWIIFAVLKVDVSNSNKTAFNYMIGDFESDAQFMNYVYSIKQLSYLNVDVPINEEDSLLTMSTCSYESQNGRTVVIARKVRPDEDVSSYIRKAKKNSPVSKITTTFSKDLEAGKIKWYDGKGNLKGEEKTEYLEPTKIYTVTYVDAKDKPLYIQRVMEGADAKPYDGELPRKAAEDGYYYKFSKWDTDTTNVQEDLTVRPVFTKHKMPTPTTTARATAKTEAETEAATTPIVTIPNDKPETPTTTTPSNP